MSIAGMVAAIRAALHKKVVCPSCRHKQEVLKKERAVKCAKCGAQIQVAPAH
jgi:ribosomal protein S27E